MPAFFRRGVRASYVTFSICAHEPYEDADAEQHRFGVAVTTRPAGVGTLCPFASENGTVATQSLLDVELGRKGIEYLDDGLAVEDALQGLLNADDGAESRQLHRVDREARSSSPARSANRGAATTTAAPSPSPETC